MTLQEISEYLNKLLSLGADPTTPVVTCGKSGAYSPVDVVEFDGSIKDNEKDYVVIK